MLSLKLLNCPPLTVDTSFEQNVSDDNQRFHSLERYEYTPQLPSRLYPAEEHEQYSERLQTNPQLEPDKNAKITLSLCMIVKDEEEYLPECLESVKNVVDEMIVVDTGSSDETVAIAKNYGARVFSYPWTADFAAARNYSLSYSSSDWNLCLDADERLPRHYVPLLKKLTQNPIAIAYSVRIVSPLKNPNSSQCQITTGHRLFRNMPEIRFRGRVHEQIIYSLERIGVSAIPTDMTIIHLGYAKSPEDLEEKYDRNLALLRMQIREEPMNSYAHYNLGQTLLLKGKQEQAVHALNTALEIGNLPDDIEASIYNNLAECHFLLGNFNECLRNCETSLKICPNQLIAHATAYKVYIARDNFQEALNELYAIHAFQNRVGINNVNTVAVGAFVEQAKLDYNLGVCHAQLGQYAEAIVHLRRAIDHRQDTCATDSPQTARQLTGKDACTTGEKASKLLSFILEKLSSKSPQGHNRFMI